MLYKKGLLLSTAANQDYIPLDVVIVLSGMGSKCYNVVIVDNDDIVEASESFSVELVDIVGRFRVLQSSVTITISPNQQNIDSESTTIKSLRVSLLLSINILTCVNTTNAG